jgi:hypothetical protein
VASAPTSRPTSREVQPQATTEKGYRADDDEDPDLVIQLCAMGRASGAKRGGGRRGASGRERGGASGRGGATGRAAAQEQIQRNSDIADQVAGARHDNRLTNVLRSTLPESADSIAERLAGDIESAIGPATRIEIAAGVREAERVHQTLEDAGLVTDEQRRQHLTDQAFAAEDARINYGAVRRETRRFLEEGGALRGGGATRGAGRQQARGVGRAREGCSATATAAK